MGFNLTDPRVRDLADEAKSGPKTLPEGKHLMRCRDVTHKEINGNETWALDLVVVAGEPHEHTSCRDRLFFTERAIGRILLVMNAFGVKDEQLADVDPASQEHRNLLIGRTAIVTIEHQDGKDGKKWANPTYAGYEVAHKGAIDAMRDEQASGGGSGSAPPSDSGAAAAPKQQGYGEVPF